MRLSRRGEGARESKEREREKGKKKKSVSSGRRHWSYEVVVVVASWQAFNPTTFVSGHAQQIFFFGFCSADAVVAVAGVVICLRARKRERGGGREGERALEKEGKGKKWGKREFVLRHFFFLHWPLPI